MTPPPPQQAGLKKKVTISSLCTEMANFFFLLSSLCLCGRNQRRSSRNLRFNEPYYNGLYFNEDFFRWQVYFSYWLQSERCIIWSIVCIIFVLHTCNIDKKYNILQYSFPLFTKLTLLLPTSPFYPLSVAFAFRSLQIAIPRGWGGGRGGDWKR